MDTEEAKAMATLFAKLARVMGKVRNLEKTGFNEHFKYKFVTDGAVSHAISDALAAENVAFIPSILESRNDGKITHTRFLFTFACGDTGAVFQATWEGEGQDNQDKGVAKSATSAVKYFLLKTFLIDTGERADDPDNDASLDKKGKAGADKPAQPKNAPKPSNPPQNAPLISSEGFSIETGRNFMGWAKRAFNFDEDMVRKTLDHAAGRELTALTMWPYSTLDAAAALIAADQEYSGDHIRGYLESVKKGGVKLLSMSGKPFTAPELEHLLSKAMELNEVKE